MKTYSKIFFAAALAAFGFTSCSREGLAPAEEPQGNLVTVHFGAESHVEVTRATLTTEDEAIFASAWEDGDVLSVYYINPNYEDATVPTSSDFKLWFNVIPTDYTSMSLTVETTGHKLTISNSTAGSYAAGRLYKVVKEIPAEKWTSTVPVYASLSELVKAGAPLATATNVTVTLKDEVIRTFTNTKGVNLLVGDQSIQIYCNSTAFPTEWTEGGTISGTLTNCKWVLYGGNTWELCPDNWDELTYTAPLKSCDTPVIALDGEVATITCATDGATIHYTVGDSPADPTESDAVYSSPVTLTDGQTIKAIAVKDGMKPSAVTAKKYTTSGTGELKTWTYTVTETSPNFTADASIVINNATWNIEMGTTVGSPETNGKPSKFSKVYGWKWGDKSTDYWGSYTLTTSYFQDKKVKSVSVKFLNNGKKTGTMTVSQGSLTIGTASKEFAQSWNELTSSGDNLGDGGTLSITYQVAQASYIGEIIIQYYD